MELPNGIKRLIERTILFEELSENYLEEFIDWLKFKNIMDEMLWLSAKHIITKDDDNNFEERKKEIENLCRIKIETNIEKQLEMAYIVHTYFKKHFDKLNKWVELHGSLCVNYEDSNEMAVVHAIFGAIDRNDQSKYTEWIISKILDGTLTDEDLKIR